MEKKDRREREMVERGVGGGLVDDLRQTHRAKPKPKLDSMSRSVNIKCRRRAVPLKSDIFIKANGNYKQIKAHKRTHTNLNPLWRLPQGEGGTLPTPHKLAKLEAK